MSNSLATRAFVDGLSACAVAAWTGLKKVYVGSPREAPSPDALPYATVDWMGTAMAFQASGRKNAVEQSYSFDVYGIFAFPEDPTLDIDLEASDRADEFIAAAQTGPTFAAYGYLPLVSRVEPIPAFGDGEAAYGVKITFDVRASADHS